MPNLYIVPTPIGNLEDITLRALRILREVNLIAAEDTRTTRKLLTHFEIKTPLMSYHEHNKLTRLDDVLTALANGDVALVSDAGTPGISDPGYELVQAALAEGVTVVPLPGPSAILTALVGSGMPPDRFLFVGFLPRKSGAVRTALESLAAETGTIIAYESPHRLLATLEALCDVLGDRPLVVARELTKLHEELWRGTALQALDHFTRQPPRGEITLVVAGAPAPAHATRWETGQVRAALRSRLAAGEGRSTAARAIAAQAGWSRREVYALDLDDPPRTD